MFEFYKSKIDEDVLKDSRKQLRNLYAEIPETKGCMDNINKEGGCGAWCCREQNPQVMYVEFLNTWNSILNGQPTDKIASLVIKAVRVYLDESPTKGCMMWDKNSKQCTIHSTRPMNCRMYGQIPEEEFKPRFERLKVLYADKPEVVIRDQCNLVESVGKKPTVEDSDKWMTELDRIENFIGIPASFRNDGMGGSYRTFHDHILLRLCGLGFWQQISNLRLSGTKDDKEKFVKDLVERMRKAHPYLEDTQDDAAPKPQIILET